VASAAAIGVRAGGGSSRIFKVWPEVGYPLRLERVVVVQPRDGDHRCPHWQVFGIVGSVGVNWFVRIDHAGSIGPKPQANLKGTSSRK
jgi:hypothetical protein